MHFPSISFSVTAVSLVLSATLTNAIDFNDPNSALNNGQIKLPDDLSIVCRDQGCPKSPFGDTALAPGRDDHYKLQNDSSVECNENGCAFIPSHTRLPKDSSIFCSDQGCFTVPSADITITANFKPISFSKDSTVVCNSHGCTTIPALAKTTKASPTTSYMTLAPPVSGHGPVSDSMTFCHGDTPVCTTFPAAIARPLVEKDDPNKGQRTTVICSNNSTPGCVSVPAIPVETALSLHHDSITTCNHDDPPQCWTIAALAVETSVSSSHLSGSRDSITTCNHDDPPHCVTIAAPVVLTSISHPGHRQAATTICNEDNSPKYRVVPAGSAEPDSSGNAGTQPRDEL